jgi:large subunit ribosomal protein L10
MAVTRADKELELQQLERAFKGSESAILVDYKGLNVPQVTELRRQLRTAKASYRVVKNTIARRALKGTSFEVLDQYFAGTTAVAYTATDPVALAKTLTTFAKTAPKLTIKSGDRAGAGDQPRRGDRARGAAGSPELLAKLLFVIRAPMVQDRQGAGRCAAGSG